MQTREMNFLVNINGNRYQIQCYFNGFSPEMKIWDCYDQAGPVDPEFNSGNQAKDWAMKQFMRFLFK